LQRRCVWRGIFC